MNQPIEKNEEINWLEELHKVQKYCNRKSYSVVYKPVEYDFVDLEKKKITISTSHSYEIALYSLLHEMGHVTLCNRKKSYKTNFDYVFENFSKSSMVYKLTILLEELDAWKEGLKLAERLNIRVDRRKFEITKAKCISTYITWIR